MNEQPFSIFLYEIIDNIQAATGSDNISKEFIENKVVESLQHMPNLISSFKLAMEMQRNEEETDWNTIGNFMDRMTRGIKPTGQNERSVATRNYKRKHAINLTYPQFENEANDDMQKEMGSLMKRVSDTIKNLDKNVNRKLENHLQTVNKLDANVTRKLERHFDGMKIKQELRKPSERKIERYTYNIDNKPQHMTNPSYNYQRNNVTYGRPNVPNFRWKTTPFSEYRITEKYFNKLLNGTVKTRDPGIAEAWKRVKNKSDMYKQFCGICLRSHHTSKHESTYSGANKFEKKQEPDADDRRALNAYYDYLKKNTKN